MENDKEKAFIEAENNTGDNKVINSIASSDNSDNAQVGKFLPSAPFLQI